MKLPFAFLFSLLLLAFPFQSAMAQSAQVTDPWIREPPPGAAMLAAYMTIENTSSETLLLNSVSSPDFGMVEIHRTTMEEGVARMKKIDQLEILAGKSVVLEPGGYHLMLMHPQRALHADDTVELQLRFDGGEAIPVTATVRKQ